MRRKNAAFIAALAVTAATPARSQAEPHERGTLTSGNRFERECRPEVPTRYAYCLGYSTGLWDIVTLDNGWGICPPDGVDMGQALNVGLAYMRDNPAKTHETPGLLFIQSWKKAFPCLKTRRPGQQ